MVKRFILGQHQSLRKEEDSHSSADISSGNSISKSNSPRPNKDHHQQHQKENFQSNTDISSNDAIAQGSSQRFNRDHQQQRQSQNSPEQERKTYHQVESEKLAACSQSQESEYQPRVIKTIEVTDKDSLSTVGRTAVQRNQRILKKVEVSDLEESTDSDMRVKQRKGNQATGKRKIYDICQRSRGDVDFEAERIKDHTFAIKQGDQGYVPADEHRDQPNLTLWNVDCIPRFSNNISCHLGTTIRNNDDNENIVASVNYFVPRSQLQLHPVYY